MGSRQSIVFQAVAFGYGPASISVALARHLRAVLEGEVDLIALGEGVALEFLQASGVFDRVYQFQVPDLYSPAPDALRRLRAADAILTMADFDFAIEVRKLGRKAFMVDPLYWMWDQDPIPISACRDYYVVDFPGVSDRIDRHRRQAPDDPHQPVRVEPVCDEITLAQLAKERTTDSLVINFGGIDSPFGANEDLVVEMAASLVRVAAETNRYSEIFTCGGRRVMNRLRGDRRVKLNGGRLHIGPLPPQEFLRQMARCRQLLTVPGLSVTCEAVALGKPTVFLLPLNYSQHGQARRFREILKNAQFVSWADFPGYHEPMAGLPEREGVQLSLDLGRRFAREETVRRSFERRVRDALSKATLGACFRSRREMFTRLPMGAEQIVSKLLRSVPTGAGRTS